MHISIQLQIRQRTYVLTDGEGFDNINEGSVFILQDINKGFDVVE